MKNRIVLFSVISALFAFVLSGCSLYFNAPPQAAEDEIKLQIQLDLKEDIGLLIIDYDVSGTKGSGGISNADKSMIKRSELLDWTFDKKLLDGNVRADREDLTLRFTVVTEYADSNYDNIYPEEFTVPMNEVSLKANYGGTYRITISGDKTNGYHAVPG